MEVTINGKTYVLKYTRSSICKAEEDFGISMIKREEPKTFSDTMLILKSLLYGALCESNKGIKPSDMNKIYDEFVGEDGFEQEALIEGLTEMLGKAINPTGGKRRKKFTLK